MGTHYYDYVKKEAVTSTRLNEPWDSSGNLKTISGGALLDANEEKIISFPASVTNPVNYIEAAPGATTIGPVLTAKGSDTNIDISLTPKGTGVVSLGQATSAGVKLNGDQPILDNNSKELLKFTSVANAVNEITISNAASEGSPGLTATGGDTNIDIALTPKGTGNLIIDSMGVGIQRKSPNATSGNVFRKCTGLFASTGGANAVVTLTGSSNVFVMASGMVTLMSNTGGYIGQYAWVASWGDEDSTENYASITAIATVGTAPTIAHSSANGLSTLSITCPVGYQAFITCDLADRNNALAGITWGSAFGG